MIYTRIVMNMSTGRTLEAEGFEHHGPVAECMGGGNSGSSTTNTVDYEYNRRMATLSEEQQAWAKDYFEMWRDHMKPYEIAQTRTNMEMLPLESDLYRQQLSTAKELLPQQAATAQRFLAASTRGVDVNERMALATADAANAWKDARERAVRDNARMGVNPNSGRFQGIAAALDTREAAQLAGARTQARVGAEQENYERLKNAANLNPANGILQGLGASKS